MSALDTFLPLPEEHTSLSWPLILPRHLSASSLGLLQRCPEQWRRRYLLFERDRLNGAIVWGAADHYAHEVNFRQKITSHEDLPLEDVKQAFATGFDEKTAEGNGEVDWGDDKPGEMKDAGVKLAAAYHQHVSPLVQPVAVEERFEIDVPGVPVPLVGFMDVRTAGEAIERKTSGRKEVVPKPRWRIQGLIYQLANQTPVDWHVSTKTKTPAVYTPANEPGLRLADSRAGLTERLVLNLAQQIVSLHDTYGPDDPWPGAITDDWACLYCPHGPRGLANCHWWS